MGNNINVGFNKTVRVYFCVACGQTFLVPRRPIKCKHCTLKHTFVRILDERDLKNG